MDVSALEAFHFLHPLWLLALPPLLALAVVKLVATRAGDGAWSRIVDAHLLPLLSLGGATRGRSPWVLIGAAWSIAVLALAGPSWQRLPGSVLRLPASWVVLLDLSPAMAATDVTPDRATRARYAIRDILSAAHDARVALIAFAGEPYTVTPLTTDVATIRSLLEPLSPRLMPEAGNELTPALIEAGRLLRAGGARHGEIIVLTDGIADPARALGAAAQLRRDGVTVHVIGIGTASGAPERDAAGSFIRDEQGDILITRLQSGTLARVAAAGGGQFVTLAGVGALIAALHAAQSRAFDSAPSRARGPDVTSWRNDGVLLLPPLLLLVALIVRRGWL